VLVLSTLSSYQGVCQLLIRDDIKLMTSSMVDDTPFSMEVKRRADDMTRLPSAVSISSNSESSSSPDRSDVDSSRQERRGSRRRSMTLTKGFESEAAREFFGTTPVIPVDTTPPPTVSVSSESTSSRGRSNSDISGERRVSATRPRRSRTMSTSMATGSISEAAQDFFGNTPVVPDDTTPPATVSVLSESNVISRERSNSDTSGERRVVNPTRPRRSRTMSISEGSISEAAQEFFGTPPSTPSRDIVKAVNTQEKLDSKVVMIDRQEKEGDGEEVKVNVIEATKEEGACPARETHENNFNVPQAPSGKVDEGCQCIIM